MRFEDASRCRPNALFTGAERQTKQKAFEKLETLVIIDPYPTASAIMHDRTDGVYLLPSFYASLVPRPAPPVEEIPIEVVVEGRVVAAQRQLEAVLTQRVAVAAALVGRLGVIRPMTISRIGQPTKTIPAPRSPCQHRL